VKFDEKKVNLISKLKKMLKIKKNIFLINLKARDKHFKSRSFNAKVEKSL